MASSKLENILKVFVAVTLQLREGNIVRIHDQQMKMLKCSWVHRAETRFVVIRSIRDAHDIQIHLVLDGKWGALASLLREGCHHSWRSNIKHIDIRCQSADAVLERDGEAS